MIAGSTGSGKSEFIITYILSLALNYAPDDVAFVLIDYKGGGLSGAFKKKGAELPHLVGTITNIDKAGLQRSLDSIQSELRRRQVMFNEARNQINESTIDIYKYQKLYHEGIVKDPIPHLLIICDEFAEILATQKPSGVVNDQIISNSKFGICLKVQDKSDSMDVIKKPDAANLKRAGEFYINVGNDEYFTLGQSGWAGAPYVKSDTVQKKVDTSVDFISNIGNVVKKMEDYTEKRVETDTDQLTSIVRYLSDIAKEKNIQERQLWLDEIPANIYLDDLRNKYNVKSEKNVIVPIIGEYDNPYNQQQGIYMLDLSNGGNTIVFGGAESGKETLISTLIYDCMVSHTADEVNFYILDLGSEIFKIFKPSPIVGDVVLSIEEEKIERLFGILKNELAMRKKILAEYAGGYKMYINSSNNPMPMIVFVINNFEAFSDIYLDKYEDDFQMISREGTKYGIVTIVVASNGNDIRYRMSQNFKQKIALQLNDEEEYANIFDEARKKRPARLFGRGLIKIDNNIYEMQVAKICEDDVWNSTVKDTIDKTLEKSKGFAKTIPIIPQKVLLDDLKRELKDVTKIPIGLFKKDIQVCLFNFTRNIINIITGKSIDDIGQLTINIMREFETLKNVEVILIDEEINQNADNKLIYEKMKDELNKKQLNDQKCICIIIGIEKFLNDLDNSENEFLEFVKLAADKGNCYFIVADNANRIKNHGYDDWYKEYVSEDGIIWVGNGINDQYIMTIDSYGGEISNKCGNSYGYVMNKSQIRCIKLLGIEENEY